MNEKLNAKVGDTVIIRNRYDSRKAIVAKITPTGRIKIGVTYFDAYGRKIGGSSWGGNDYLIEATPELLQEIENKALISKAFGLIRDVKTLSLEQAKKIIAILETEK